MTDLEASRRLEDGLDLMRRVRGALESASPKGDQAMNVLDYPIMLMYSRARSLYEGVHILVKEDLAEEAMVLARSLFEESLRLMHLAKQGDLRGGYVFGWLRESIDHKRAIVSDASSLEASEKSANRLAQLDAEETQSRDAMRKHGVVTEKRFTSPENLARVHNRADDLWPYRLGHLMTHGSQVASAYRWSRTPIKDSDQRYTLRVRSDEPIPKLIAIAFATSSILHAHQSVAQIFRFVTPLANLTQFFAELEALQQQ